MRLASPALGLLALALSLSSAAPAFAGTPTGSGIGLSPVRPQPGGVAYVVEHLRAGASVEEELVVANSSRTTAHLLVNAVDGRTSTETGAVYANRQDPVLGAGRWVSPTVPALDVAPRSRRTLTFTLRVPQDAAPGDHLAGVALEDAATTDARAGALTIRSVHRNVMGVLVHVAGPAAARMAVQDATFTTLPGFGSGALRLDLRNSGQLLVRPHLQVSLAGPAGYARVVDHNLDTVLAGDVVGYPQPWPDSLAPGTYDVAVRLTAPGMAPVAYTTQLHLGDTLRATSARALPAAPAAHRDLRPAVAAAAVAAGLLAGLALWRRRTAPRRRGRHARSA